MKTNLFSAVLVVCFAIMASCKKGLVDYPSNASKPMLSISQASNSAEKSACPVIDAANFGSNITNPYFPLAPGTAFHYVNRIIEGVDTSYEQVEVSVSTNTKIIAGVQCREVHDVVREIGVVTEDTYDWYAQDKSGNVWYFGEHTKSMKDKNGSTTEGSWKAGEQNACPGIIMWANPQMHTGEIYYQEFLAGTAEDQGQVVNTNSRVIVPYGVFTRCLKTKEFTNLEPGVIEYKYYAANVGLLKTEMTTGGNELEVLTTVTH
jgi:hypothetical protein